MPLAKRHDMTDGLFWFQYDLKSAFTACDSFPLCFLKFI